MYAPAPRKNAASAAARFFFDSRRICFSTAISLACIGRPSIGPESRAASGTSANSASISGAPIVSSMAERSVSVRGR